MRSFTYQDAFAIRGRGYSYILRAVDEPLTESTRIQVGEEILLNGFVFKVVGCEMHPMTTPRYIVGAFNDQQVCLLEFLRPQPRSVV
jgi:hypothetical protein